MFESRTDYIYEWMLVMLFYFSFAILIAIIWGFYIPTMIDWFVKRKSPSNGLQTVDKSFLDNRIFTSLINGIIWVAILFMNGFSLFSIELFLVFTILLMIALIDMKILIIPNELLVAFLFVTTIFYFTHCDKISILSHLGGLLAGFLICLLTSFIRGGMGAGDVKLVACIGFFAGIPGALDSIILMSLLLLVYTIYLYTFKKGNLRTLVPLGPFLMFGLFIHIIFISLHIAIINVNLFS